MRVRLFLRRPLPGQHSMERLFEALEPLLEVEPRTMPRGSQGIANRLANLAYVRHEAAEANHIAGDVHYIALALPKRGCVLTIHDLGSLHRLKGIRRAVLKALWYDLPVRRAAVVTTVSDAIRRELEEAIPAARGKTRTVANPLMPGFVADPHPFSEGTVRVLMVGAARNKNLPRQLEALEGLDVRVVLIGEPLPETAAALARVPHETKSGLTGAQMVEEYRRCDLLLFASLYEGYGMPIVEAQATGRPVVTSDRGSMQEVAGGAAILVDPESVESIRSGVRRVIEDRAERVRLIEAGYANAGKMSLARVAELYRDAYRDAYEGLH